jgi:rhodanese-related sulfurtransferase
LNKTVFLHVAGIFLLTLLAGVFYNISNPNRIQFIANEKVVDFSKSDSLMNALKLQDSLLRSADSLKYLSMKRDDSLKLSLEKHIQDSLLLANKSDSIKNAQNQQVQDFAKPVDIKIDFAKALFDKKYRFLDARDISDYDAGHVQGAMNIPFHEIEKYKDRLNDLPKDQVYVTYCSTACDVSIDMAYYMAKLGFKKVYIFHGGWDEWKAAGYPAN